MKQRCQAGNRRAIVESERISLNLRRQIVELQAANFGLRVRNRILHFLVNRPDETMYAGVLDVVLGVLKSPAGVFGYIDENEALVCAAAKSQTSDALLPFCGRPVLVRSQWTEAWGRILIEKQPVCQNRTQGFPAGHSILRSLGVPVIHAGRVIGLIYAANKASDYDEADKKILESIAGMLASPLHARLNGGRKQCERRELPAAHTRKTEVGAPSIRRIAHDFNNLLTAILGFTDLVLHGVPPDSPLRGMLGEIQNAAERAAKLAGQLLASSRAVAGWPSPRATESVNATTVFAARTILLAEDEDSARRLLTTTLQNAGYVVLEARDGFEALRLSDQAGGAIDLLLTDVVMPRIKGPELASRLLERSPNLKVLYMSGYVEDQIPEMLGEDFMEKPLRPAELLKRIEEMLIRPREGVGGMLVTQAARRTDTAGRVR